MALSHPAVVLHLLGGPRAALFSGTFLQVFRLAQGASPFRCGWVWVGRWGWGMGERGGVGRGHAPMLQAYRLRQRVQGARPLLPATGVG